MKKSVLLVFVCVLCQAAALADDDILSVLDAELQLREHHIEQKQQKIANITRELQSAHTANEKLEFYKRMASEYYVFKFDSAYNYVEKGIQLAQREHNNYYTTTFTIMKAELLAISGLYHESDDVIAKVDTAKIDRSMATDFYRTLFSIYNYWSSYCSDTPFASMYADKAMDYLEKARATMTPDYEYYDYLNGEYHVYVERDKDKARKYYNNVLQKARPASRVYAQSCFALANSYRDSGDMETFRKYLVEAVISDLQCCTMENLALQFLARELYELGDEYLERAERYMSISLEDAQFYNNRLRILEISRTFPAITNAYQKRLGQSSNILRISIFVLVALLVVLIVGLTVILRQKKKLSQNRHELAARHDQLLQANTQQTELNNRLSMLNDRLVNTNKRRERLAKLYIDLTAKYIDKLDKYQTLVKRKIKANQVADLLSKISSSRLSEEESAVFMHEFDKAFLDLYPTFIDEFNALLLPEHKIETKHLRSLTTELRIFALIRLGVKESSEIAALLFYSPQTIYNYRSTIKAHAIDRDNFEVQVAELCTIV